MLFYDSKTILQEIVQAHFKEELSYPSGLGEEGTRHDKTFPGRNFRSGETGLLESEKGRTKKRAQNRKLPTKTILMLHKKKYKVGVVCNFKKA